MIARTNLGVLPLVIWGGAALVTAGTGAYIWNKATGLWDLLTLPGSTFGPAVPMPEIPPAPSGAGAMGTEYNAGAQAAADAGNYALWQRAAFDPYAAVAGGSVDLQNSAGPASPASSSVPGWVLPAALAVAGVLLIGGRR